MRGRDRLTHRRLRNQRWYFGLVIYMLVMAITIILFRGPTPVEPFAAKNVSATNLVFEIENLLGAESSPHPAGSEENLEVRDRLIARLRALGLEVETFSFRVNGLTVGDEELTLTNVLARRPGRSTPRPVVMSAHYDSCRFGPGVGDDLAGVASLIENVRSMAVRRSEMECWFLFTDGEELGLKGAHEFVASQYFQNRGRPLVLNWDARGDEGSVLMFQTHTNNYGLVRKLIHALSFPRFTNSLMANVYEKLPNDTDFTPFKRDGWMGFNFAMLDGAHRYHTPEDNLSNISYRSLQHYASHGQQLLKTIEGWSEGDWQQLDGDTPAVFFDILGGPILVYPEYWNPILTLLAWLLVGAAMYRYQRIAPLRARPLAGLITFMMLLVLGTALFDWAMVRTLLWLKVFPAAHFQGSNWIVGLYALPPILTVFGMAQWVFGRRQVQHVRLAYWFCWAFMATVTTLYLPGAAYIFHWPLFASIALGLLGPRASSSDFWSLILQGLVMVPLAVLFGIALGPTQGGILGVVYALVVIPTLPLLSRSVDDNLHAGGNQLERDLAPVFAP